MSRKSLFTALLFMFLAVWLAAAPCYAKKAETGFLDRTITVAGTTYKYQVFVPDNWSSKKVWAATGPGISQENIPGASRLSFPSAAAF